MDENDDGLQIDALEQALADIQRRGRRARMLYCVPTFHNPTGASLNLQRRRALVELATREDLLVIEDDVYRDVAYDGMPPPSLWSMDTAGCVLRLGSFAKSLAPGLRLGDHCCDGCDLVVVGYFGVEANSVRRLLRGSTPMRSV